MVTTRPTLHDDEPLPTPAGSRPAAPPRRRVSSTGAAASLAITLAPGTVDDRRRRRVGSRLVELRAAPSAAAQTAVDTARDQVGKAYEYGGTGPDSYDCSGLTQYAYRSARDRAAAPELRPGHGSGTFTSIAPTCGRATWSSTTSRSATSASTSATVMIVHAGTEETGVAYENVDMAGYNTARRIA